MSKENEKRLYNERKDSGICVKCGKHPKSESSLICERCSQKRSERYQKRLASGKCSCGRKLSGGVVCDSCSLKRNELTNKKRREYLDSGLCRCGREKFQDRKTCDICNDRVKEYDAMVKDEVFEAYGGYVCKCCNEKERVFLAIDHIHNDGAEHRRTLFGKNGSGGGRMYKWLRKNHFPDGFQVLCFNCNHAKRFGVCPHQLKGG